jgi:SAM-dependent methyltransferase
MPGNAFAVTSMRDVSNPYALQPVPETTSCKCCDSVARLTGVVDFSKCGRDWLAGRKVEPYVGWPIYYYRCADCGFVFTRSLDDWSNADFARHIYNDEYGLHDPGYLDERPKSYADLIQRDFGDDRANTTILDYGSGAGHLERFLRERGFTAVTSYDPFSSPSRPVGEFNMITCFEVFEHTTDPRALMADIVAHLADDGAVLFSTALCTPEIIDQGLANWWYCGPRSGHISFYSRETLLRLAAQFGLGHAWFDDMRHIFHRDAKPGWLKRFLPESAL